jgi:hypothetical protein
LYLKSENGKAGLLSKYIHLYLWMLFIINFWELVLWE